MKYCERRISLHNPLKNRNILHLQYYLLCWYKSTKSTVEFDFVKGISVLIGRTFDEQVGHVILVLDEIGHVGAVVVEIICVIVR